MMPMRRRRGRGRGGVSPRRISRFVEPALLLLVRRKPMHGYGLIEGLRSLGFEEYPVDVSAIYRTLRGLEASEMVQSDWDLEVTGGPLRATDRVLHAFFEAYEKDLSGGNGLG